MGILVTRSSLETRVRQLTGMENTGGSATRLFVGQSELQTMLDSAAKELYDRLLKANGHGRFSKTGTLTTVIGQSLLTLPNDFYELLSVRGNFNGTWVELDPFAPAEVADLRNAASSGFLTVPRYRLQGTYATAIAPTSIEQLRLEPAPTAAYPIELDYVPTYLLEAIGGVIAYDGINGWEDAIVFGVAADMIAKEEGDPSYYIARKNEIHARIDALAGKRDRSKPSYVVCRDSGGRYDRGRRWP